MSVAPEDTPPTSSASVDPGAETGLLQRLLAMGHAGVVLFDADRRATWTAGTLPGIAPGDALGRSCRDLFEETDEPCEPCLLDVAAREGPQRRIVHTRPREGRPDAAFEIFVGLRDEDRPDSGFALIARELSGREGLRRFFEATVPDVVQMIDAWSVPVVVVDGDDRVRAWNVGARKLYRRGSTEAIGKRWTEITSEEDVLDLPHIPSTRTRRYEARHLTSDGHVLHVMVTRTGIRGPSEASEGAFLLVMDLSVSKALERGLARRVAQLSVIREIGEGLQSAMDLGRILRTILVGATAAQGLRFNRAFLVLVDEDRGVLVGRDAIGPSDPDEASRIWSELQGRDASLTEMLRRIEPLLEDRGGRVTGIVRALRVRLEDEGHFLIRALRAPGTVLVVDGRESPGATAVDPAFLELMKVRDFVAVPLQTETGPVGLLLADNAITGKPIERDDVSVLELLGMQAALAIERARLTEALARQVESLERATLELRQNQERLVRYERLSAIGEMAARVAHEIRNPLVAIGGFARSLLRQTPAADTRRDALEIIVDEVRRLESIVREVLDYSRPAPPRIGKVQLQRLALECLDLLRYEMDSSAVIYRVEATDNLPCAAADRDQLFQALVNILTNAIHAMPRGGELSVRLDELPGGVEMTVQDTGVGMSQDVRSRIFEPFFTTKPAGSGLGLTIAEQIIRDHQGEIHIESREGEGTIVFIRLPVFGEEDRRVEDSRD